MNAATFSMRYFKSGMYKRMNLSMNDFFKVNSFSDNFQKYFVSLCYYNIRHHRVFRKWLSVMNFFISLKPFKSVLINLFFKNVYHTSIMNFILQEFSETLKSKIKQDGLEDILQAASSDILFRYSHILIYPNNFLKWGDAWLASLFMRYFFYPNDVFKSLYTFCSS